MLNDIKFDAADRWTIGILCVLCLLGVSAFFVYVNALGLTSYSEIGMGSGERDPRLGYFMDALEYRERRLTLALILRTFISSLGFTVGLVLSVVGGVFILRRATAEFAASGQFGPPADAAPVVEREPPAQADTGAPADNVAPAAQEGGNAPKPAGKATMAGVARRASFSLASNSPGIIFMLGGVLVIYMTQALAIPVASHEIVPADAMFICSDDADNKSNLAPCPEPATRPQLAQSIVSGGDDTKLRALLSWCASKPEDAGCKALQDLQQRLGGGSK